MADYLDSIETIRDYGLRRRWRARQQGMLLELTRGSREIMVTFARDGKVSSALVDGRCLGGRDKLRKIMEELNKR
jgi:hypothetical protein